jgi:hypothetical protein
MEAGVSIQMAAESSFRRQQNLRRGRAATVVGRLLNRDRVRPHNNRGS